MIIMEREHFLSANYLIDRSFRFVENLFECNFIVDFSNFSEK